MSSDHATNILIYIYKWTITGHFELKIHFLSRQSHSLAPISAPRASFLSVGEIEHTASPNSQAVTFVGRRLRLDQNPAMCLQRGSSSLPARWKSLLTPCDAG
jgi:hypothetical protein